MKTKMEIAFRKSVEQLKYLHIELKKKTLERLKKLSGDMILKITKMLPTVRDIYIIMEIFN